MWLTKTTRRQRTNAREKTKSAVEFDKNSLKPSLFPTETVSPKSKRAKQKHRGPTPQWGNLCA